MNEITDQMIANAKQETRVMDLITEQLVPLAPYQRANVLSAILTLYLGEKPTAGAQELLRKMVAAAAPSVAAEGERP